MRQLLAFGALCDSYLFDDVRAEFLTGQHGDVAQEGAAEGLRELFFALVDCDMSVQLDRRRGHRTVRHTDVL